MVGAIRQTPSGRYVTVMVPQAWILFPFPYLSIVCHVFFFFFPFFSFVFFWPFSGTSVISPSLTVTRPRPSERRAPRRQDPSTGGHSFRVFSILFYSPLEAPCESSRAPRARLPGLVGTRPWAESAPPQIGALLLGRFGPFGLDPGRNPTY